MVTYKLILHDSKQTRDNGSDDYAFFSLHSVSRT